MIQVARVTVAALVSVATAVVLTVAPTASAHSGAGSKAFDPDEVGWASVSGRTVDEFRAIYERAGLRLSRIVESSSVMRIIEGVAGA